MSKEPQSSGDIVFYATPDGSVRVDVVFDDETFWLSQKRMSELFGVEVNTINYHLKEVFGSGELSAEATIRKIRIVQTEGNREVSRQVECYNLDAFLKFNEYDILTHAGSVSHEVAKELAEQHYERFRVNQDRSFESDFDEEIRRVEGREKPNVDK